MVDGKSPQRGFYPYRRRPRIVPGPVIDGFCFHDTETGYILVPPEALKRRHHMVICEVEGDDLIFMDRRWPYLRPRINVVDLLKESIPNRRLLQIARDLIEELAWDDDESDEQIPCVAE